MTEKEFQDAASRQLHGPHPFSREALQSPVPAMTLRDWLAGQALAGLVTNPRDVSQAWFEELHGKNASFVQIAAFYSYRLADAMLAARPNGGGQ